MVFELFFSFGLIQQMKIGFIVDSQFNAFSLLKDKTLAAIKDKWMLKNTTNDHLGCIDDFTIDWQLNFPWD